MADNFPPSAPANRLLRPGAWPRQFPGTAATASPAPAARCARIVKALEDLVDQEHAALHTHDFAAAGEIADRAAPLVEFLVSHAADVVRDGLSERLARIRERRATSEAWLGDLIAVSHEELMAATAARRTVAQVAPVYGRPAFAASQVSMVG